MRNPSLFVLVGSLAVVAFVLPQCSNGTQDCSQTSTCPSDAADGPPPLSCDTTKDPKDAPGCLDNRVGVFVDVANGKDTNPGTKEAPFQTIGKALTSVGALTRVYVCEGTYPEDVTIAPPVDGISIYGGFKCIAWTYTGNQPVVGKGTLALKISGTTKAFTVQDLLIHPSDGNAQSPSSIAALVANASAVTFTRMNFVAGVGLTGADGAAGANWTIASSSDPAIKGKDATAASGGALQTCANLCTDTVTSTGGTGGSGTTNPTDGQTGSPNLGGGAGGSHLQTCGAGGTGGNGTSATTVGADAVSPTSLGALSDTGWTPGAATAGKNGAPGQGGGGGAGQSQSNDGGGGGGACGGCGGGGGGGGSAGGASIALAALTSSITVNASQFHASDAGNGGKGKAGQVGQTGGAHGNGSGFGCSGGNGGTGSAGGTGAGGVGGISVGVLYKGTQPTLDGTTTGQIVVGKGGTKGAGGTSGTNDGIDGVAQPFLAAP